MLPTEVVAISHEGVCAFAAEFAAGRGVRKDMQGMIRVVNGGFGIGSKSSGSRLGVHSVQEVEKAGHGRRSKLSI